MIEVVRPDGIVLATPTPLHLQQGLICVEAGIPLLIEKPVTVTSSEARKLTNAAKLANVSLLVGHHRRHNGMVQAAKAAIEASFELARRVRRPLLEPGEGSPCDPSPRSPPAAAPSPACRSEGRVRGER